MGKLHFHVVFTRVLHFEPLAVATRSHRIAQQIACVFKARIPCFEVFGKFPEVRQQGTATEPMKRLVPIFLLHFLTANAAGVVITTVVIFKPFTVLGEVGRHNVVVANNCHFHWVILGWLFLDTPNIINYLTIVNSIS